MSEHEQMRERLDLARALAVPIKELSVSERPLLKQHLLALGAEDRYLRFGNPLSDQTIADYVDGIDFSRDVLFGVFDEGLELVAAGHFAHLTGRNTVEHAGLCAEFGLSVDQKARARGLGTALFVRAATHARNLGVTTLFMHCLIQNKAVMRIARKSGMQVTSQAGQADAYITLGPADATSVVCEAVQEQIAVFDYAIKQQLFNARRELAREDTSA